MALESILKNVRIEWKETDPCTRKAEIKYTSEDVDAAFASAAKEAGKYAQIPGFRKGKAPLSMVMTRYKDYILDDVVRELQQAAFSKILEEKDMDIVTYGRFNAPAAPEAKKEYACSIEVEVAPAFELPAYKELPVKLDAQETLEKHLASQKDYLKGLYAEIKSVEEPAKLDDMLKVSYSSDLELPADASAQMKRAAGAEEGWFWLSQPEQMPGLVAALTGAVKGGEYTFTSDYPADWREPSLQGKKVNYKVKVAEVQRRVPVASEEELAKKLNMESVEKMNESLTERAKMEMEQARLAQIKGKVSEEVIAKTPEFELPKGMLSMATQKEFSRIADRLVRKEADIETFKADKDKHLEEAKTEATKSLRKYFIFRKIAKLENITVAPEEVDQQISAMCAYMGYKEKDVRKNLDQNGGYSDVEADIMMGKVTDLLASSAKAE